MWKVRCWEMNDKEKKYIYISGTGSYPSSKARRLTTQCRSITGRHPAHFSSVTSTPCPILSLKFRGPLFIIFLLFVVVKKFLNRNDVQFDFSIVHALVLFTIFLIINIKSTVDHVRHPHPPRNSHISIYFGQNFNFTKSYDNYLEVL